jgi:hypothetical protein
LKGAQGEVVAGWWEDGEQRAVWEGCWVERMVRTGVQHVRGSGSEVWDVCAWGFGCFRGTGVERFRNYRGGCGDGREGI